MHSQRLTRPRCQLLARFSIIQSYSRAQGILQSKGFIPHVDPYTTVHRRDLGRIQSSRFIQFRRSGSFMRIPHSIFKNTHDERNDQSLCISVHLKSDVDSIIDWLWRVHAGQRARMGRGLKGKTRAAAVPAIPGQPATAGDWPLVRAWSEDGCV